MNTTNLPINHVDVEVWAATFGFCVVIFITSGREMLHLLREVITVLREMGWIQDKSAKDAAPPKVDDKPKS